MKEQIKNYLNRYVAFEDAEIDDFYANLKPKTFRKKEYLLKQDQICKSNFFISEGLVRSFYIDEKGNEKIIQFAIENWWVTNVESFIQDMPSAINIQAIEDTTALVLYKNDLDQLYKSIPKLERLFRMITENTLIAVQRNNNFFSKKSSKERYFNFVNSFPGFAQRVPQYMIASFLDITPEYLSELRKNH